MMNIYTMGFVKKSAEEFFLTIKENQIQILIDIRINNQSQLCGFTKARDLPFFLSEICDCEYSHMTEYAPTKEILDDYKKKKIDWDGYVKCFLPLIEGRKIEDSFVKKYSQYDNVLLLCSEPTADKCHRRLVAEYIQDKIDCKIIHL